MMLNSVITVVMDEVLCRTSFNPYCEDNNQKCFNVQIRGDHCKSDSCLQTDVFVVKTLYCVVCAFAIVNNMSARKQYGMNIVIQTTCMFYSFSSVYKSHLFTHLFLIG